MNNFESCKYTYKHRKALEYLINLKIKDENIKKEMLKRAKIHDMDKMTLYLIIDKSEASKLHRKTASHHMENKNNKDYYDYLEYKK